MDEIFVMSSPPTSSHHSFFAFRLVHFQLSIFGTISIWDSVGYNGHKPNLNYHRQVETVEH